MMKRILNGLLLISFVLTILVPLTGILIHKLSSTLFVILCFMHLLVYRQKMNLRRWLLLGLVLVSYITGCFALIGESNQAVLILHRLMSAGVIFCMGIHIFLYHKKGFRLPIKSKE